MTVLIFALIALLQAPAAAVEGTITKPGGGEPMAGAKVTLFAADPESKAQISVTSEDDGRFSFAAVPQGNYTLRVESSRYGSVAFGQRRPDGPASILSLSAGQRLTGLQISMFPTGAIAGRITGRNGEPVVRASVHAYQNAYRDGKRTLVPIQSTTANDLGEYRLFWLPPGKYFVAATLGESGVFSPYGPGVQAPDEGIHLTMSPTGERLVQRVVRDSFTGGVIRRLLDDGTVQEEAWIPMYYPGTTEPRDATPLDVAAGATMNGVNIAIAPSPVRKVSGQVIAPAGLVVRVRLVYLPGGPSMTVPGPAFEFKGVKPGTYVLTAEDARNYASSAIPVEVGNRDIENLRIGLRPKATLTGRVIVENSPQETAGPNPLAGIAITLYQGDVELPMNTFQPGTGSFTVNNVSPGEYQIQVRSLVELAPGIKPLYVKSARLGQTDVLNGFSITDATEAPLEIVLTRGSGSVEGVVIDPGRSAAAGATVVLVPSVARKNTSLYKSTVADASGLFRFQGVAVGDYLVFAWTDVETGAWQNAEFMRPFESRGYRVRISPNSKQDVQIPLISAP